MFRFLNKTEYSRYYKSIFFHNHVTPSIQSCRHKSHYTSLGLDTSASQKDIKSAYYNLSLKFHPDKNDGSPESVEKFREIAEAYEVLGNPEKKKVYDRDFTGGMGYSTDFKKDGYGARSGYYYNRHSPRSGRDQYYNYEEHIRKHYENFYREKQAENEQFRRRWEADRRQREGEYWSNYRRPTQPPAMKFKDIIRTKTFLYTATFWFFLFVLSVFNDLDKPKRRYNYSLDDSKLYYDVKKNSDKEK